MAYEYREPDVVETRREVVVDRDEGSSAGAVIGIVLAVLLVLGLIGFFAFGTGRSSTTEVRVDTPADTGRAQEFNVDAPDVNVAPPSVNVNPPDINVEPPIINNNPPASGGSGSGDAGATGAGTAGG